MCVQYGVILTIAVLQATIFVMELSNLAKWEKKEKRYPMY